jgi:hypothetical protein
MNAEYIYMCILQYEAIEMSQHLISDGKLVIGNIEVQLPYRVKSAITVNRLLIVAVESPVGVLFDRNVYAIDEAGKIIWQIEKATCYGGRKECPYIGIKISEDGDLIAVTGVGAEFKVNLDTGQIELYDFSRF